MPIPRNTIRKLAQSNSVYTQGLGYLTGMSVKNTEVLNSEFVDIYHIKGAIAVGNRVYHPSAEIDDSAQEINSYHCDCADSGKSGACKHVVGLLLTLENRFFNQNISRRADKDIEVKQKEEKNTAQALINSYARKTVRKTLAEQNSEPVKFLPVFDFSEPDNIKLSFRLGNDHMYVIKDLTVFYNDMKNGNVKEYGKYFSFLHDESNFSEESLPFLHFFMSHFDGFLKSQFSMSEIKHMAIAPYMFDELLELCGENYLVTTEQRLKIKKHNPQMCLYIKKSGSSYVMRLSNSEFVLIKGYSRLYIMRGESLYVCDKDFSDICSEFLTEISEKEQLSISCDDMRAFYNNVIASIFPFINIRTTEDLEEFVPKPLEAKIYFDKERNGRIIASLKFIYGDEEYEAYDKKREFKTVGNLRAELLVKTVLERFMQGIDEENGYAYIYRDDEKIFTLLTEGLDVLRKYAEVFATENFRTIKIKPAPSVGVGVRLDSDLLNLNILLDGIERQELTDVLTSYRQRKKYHRLKDGSFIDLKQGSLSELASLTVGLHLNVDSLSDEVIAVPKFRAMYLDRVLKESAHLHYERGGGFKEMIMSIRDSQDTHYAVPQALKHILRNYQKHGFRWLKTLINYGFCGILADDMGLGKTLEIISLLLSEKEEKGRVSALVVCPSSLVLNWDNEIKKFAPELSALALIGNAEEREQKLGQIENHDIVITSYELLKRDLESYQKHIFDFEIIDEAQYIKNFRTQNAKAVKAISSKNRMALTGTPIENSLAELWSIFDFLMPDFLFSYAHFKKSYEVPIIKEKDEDTLNDLRKMVSPFILRRLKGEVLKELPEKTETVIYSQFGSEQEKLYAANLAEMRAELEESLADSDFSKSRFHILAMLTRLRQLCCHPSLVYENYKEQSAKCEACMELIENSIESGHKILVFSQFTSMLDILQQELSDRKIPFYLIEGATKHEERVSQVDKFNSDNTPVFLVSLKAGGTGLNLTGADVVIHYDPWWNLSVQNQASDRAHRIGQKNHVQVFKLIVKNSIEEKILRLQEKKAELADSIIKEGDQLLSAMDKEEILRLFE